MRRIARAFRYSFKGLASAARGEPAFLQELIVCAFLIPVAVWLGDDSTERALMIGTLLIVLIVELINTAIETVVDRIGPERDELSGRAKDLGSAAVFVSLVLAAVVWGFALLG